MSKIFLNTYLLILSLAFVSSAADRDCGSGWAVRNGACYQVFAKAVTQKQALDACHDLGANLASIHNVEVQKYLIVLCRVADPAKNFKFWIGLTLRRHTGNSDLMSCTWSDGSPFDYGECVEHSGKAPWAVLKGASYPDPNELSARPEACVALSHDGGAASGWLDHNCTDSNVKNLGSFGYVCQK